MAAIELAPGLELVVAPDFADSIEATRLVEKCKTLLNRAEHVVNIKVAIETWRSDDDEDGIHALLGMLGWSTTHTRHTADELARAALALLELAELSDVISCAEHCLETLAVESAIKAVRS